jgi:tRNA pseudouridine13 synthase
MEGNLAAFTGWFDRLPYAHGKPHNSGVVKASPEDFQVFEQLAFEPEGEGEHVYLKLQKRELNTEEVVRKLAKIAGVRSSDIGYAGLKDRFSVSQQWFSVHLPGGSEPDWKEIQSDRILLLEQTRHARKLRIGALTGNRFKLCLRQVEGGADLLEDRLQCILHEGVPNYYGEQRFGYQSENLVKAVELFTGIKSLRKGPLRSIVISAARSFLFNKILSERILNKTWNQAIHGDVMMLDGSSSFFMPDTLDEQLTSRLRKLDIHPTGALWGRGEMPVTKTCRYLEINALMQYPLFLEGLENQGLKQDRRALRLKVGELSWRFQDATTLQMECTLPPGSYATMVLRELVS